MHIGLARQSFARAFLKPDPGFPRSSSCCSRRCATQSDHTQMRTCRPPACCGRRVWVDAQGPSTPYNACKDSVSFFKAELQ